MKFDLITTSWHGTLKEGSGGRKEPLEKETNEEYEVRVTIRDQNIRVV